MTFSLFGRFLTLALLSPILAWGAQLFLITQGWIAFDLKSTFTERELVGIFFASTLAIAVPGWMLGLLGDGRSAIRLVFLCIGVSGMFVLLPALIMFPFLAWLGAVPTIIFVARSEARKERRQIPDQLSR